MRAFVYVILLALAVGSAVHGRIALALALGGAKAVLVGIEYMELRGAARAHAAGFVAGVLVLTGILVALAS
ncbi:MAG TPA: hypothetical protein VIL20_23830 [Sandaracinaceae bacterium]